jgi:hypothetical protein
MNLRPAIVFLALVVAVCAEELPRKAKTPRESYPNVDVIYDSVKAPDGKRLRAIITKPREAKGKFPVIFLAGWLSCDSVEAPADTNVRKPISTRSLPATAPRSGHSKVMTSSIQAGFTFSAAATAVGSRRWSPKRRPNRPRCAATLQSAGG